MYMGMRNGTLVCGALRCNHRPGDEGTDIMDNCTYKYERAPLPSLLGGGRRATTKRNEHSIPSPPRSCMRAKTRRIATTASRECSILGGGDRNV